MQGLLDKIEWFSENVLGLKTHHHHEHDREKFIAGHLTCTFIISILYQPFLYAIEYYAAANAVWGIILSHVLVLFPLYRRGRWKLLTHSFSATAFIAFMVVALTSGGIASPQIAWFLCVKVGAYWFYGRKEGHIWSIVTILSLSLVFLYGYYVEPFGYDFPAKYHPVFSGIIHIGVLVYYFIVLHVYESWQISAMDAVQKAAKDRDQMFRVVVHDVKNPLTVISGRAYIMQKNLEREKYDGFTKSLETIQKHTDRITVIINDTLDKSRFNKMTKNDFEEVDFVKVLGEAVSTYREHAHHKGVEVEVEVPESMTHQTNWLGVFQVSCNLLTNAIKYSEKGSTVQVRLFYCPDSKAPCLSVMDQGLGMTKKQIAAFYKGDGHLVGNAPTAGESTSGEGSSILKHFIRELGAQLKIESAGPNQGSCFTVIFSGA